MVYTVPSQVLLEEKGPEKCYPRSKIKADAKHPAVIRNVIFQWERAPDRALCCEHQIT